MNLKAIGIVVTLIFFCGFGTPSRADFGNYNLILIGSQAAGMGGAYTALSGDPSACSFYNPATLSRMEGASFAATANLYNKYDTSFSNTTNVSDSTLKLNRGSFQAIPAAAGSAISFGHFALGMSILTPDYDIYSGDLSLASNPNATSFLNYKDQSLWVGGNLAINFTDDFSAGMTVYYTSRDFQRSVSDQTTTGSNTKFTYENKAYTSNNVVYVLGAYYKLNSHWSLGLSWRAPSIQLSGDGSFYRSILDTSVSALTQITALRNITSLTHIPQKAAAGVSYEIPKKFTLAFDVAYYGTDGFRDFVDPIAGEQISYRSIVNGAIGMETYLRSWMALRTGIFSNFSSHPEISDNGVRQGDHIDMLGFSANLAIFAGKTSFTFGGYFTGGSGQSTEQLGQQIVVAPKAQYIYSLLVSSAYSF